MQILYESLLQYIFNQNQFYPLYRHVFGDAPRITCHFTVLKELKKTDYQLSRWPKRLGVRLESKGSQDRYPAETYILNFSFGSLLYRSVDPLQMKSSMNIHLQLSSF